MSKNLLIPFPPLTNLEIAEYYKDEPRFKGAYSRDNLPNNIKNGAYVINLEEYTDTGTHWVAVYVQRTKTIIYFDSFGVEHISKEIMKFIKNKDIISNIFRVQVYDSIMCGYYCVKYRIEYRKN